MIPSKKTRGLGKKPRLYMTSIRLDQYVIDYFAEQYPARKQAMMREVLANFVRSKKGETSEQAQA
jgi:hypothetical protein